MRYTAFCQQVNGRGTIWISSLEADDNKTATEAAQQSCAEDWSCDPADVHVLGLAKGNVTILQWDDLNDN